MVTLTGHSIKRTVATVMTASLAASGLAVVAGPASPAEAAKIRVCVKKKTGTMRFLFKKKKKCKKGWKRYVWNQKGVPGPAGTDGKDGTPAPALSVKDKNGDVVGGFLGLYPAAPVLSLLMVLWEGGAWTYLPGGQLYPLGGGSPKYTDNTCAGPGYIDVSSPEALQLVLTSAGGPGRFVYRPTNPSLGPAEGFALTTTNSPYTGNLWERDDTGTCVLDGGSPFTTTLVQLEKVPAPPDVPGPLTIG